MKNKEKLDGERKHENQRTKRNQKGVLHVRGDSGGREDHRENSGKRTM